MKKTVLKIDGMMCGHCEAHINDSIRNAFNVKNVKSSHQKGETEIISAESLDESRLKEIIKSSGYTLKGIKTEDYNKCSLFPFKKNK